MPIQEFNVINLKTLNGFFHGKLVGDTLVFRKMQCDQCGKYVNVEIQKTSEGYGFLNGVISEPINGKILAQCCNCNGFKKFG